MVRNGQILDMFKVKSIGFCRTLDVGVRERGEAKMTPMILFVCLFAWATGRMESP